MGFRLGAGFRPLPDDPYQCRDRGESGPPEVTSGRKPEIDPRMYCGRQRERSRALCQKSQNERESHNNGKQYLQVRNQSVPCRGEVPGGPHQREKETGTNSSQRSQCTLKESSPAQLFSQTCKAPHDEIKTE